MFLVRVFLLCFALFVPFKSIASEQKFCFNDHMNMVDDIFKNDITSLAIDNYNKIVFNNRFHRQLSNEEESVLKEEIQFLNTIKSLNSTIYNYITVRKDATDCVSDYACFNKSKMFETARLIMDDLPVLDETHEIFLRNTNENYIKNILQGICIRYFPGLSKLLETIILKPSRKLTIETPLGLILFNNEINNTWQLGNNIFIDSMLFSYDTDESDFPTFYNYMLFFKYRQNGINEFNFNNEELKQVIEKYIDILNDNYFKENSTVCFGWRCEYNHFSSGQILFNNFFVNAL